MVSKSITQVQQYHNSPSKSNLHQLNGVIYNSANRLFKFTRQRSSSAAQPHPVSKCRIFFPVFPKEGRYI